MWDVWQVVRLSSVHRGFCSGLAEKGSLGSQGKRGGVKMYIKHHEPESRLRRSAVMLSLIGAILFPLAGYIDWGKPVGDQGTRGMLQVSEIPSPEVWGSATAACSVSKDGGGCPTASSRTSPAKSDLSRLP